MRIIKKIIRLIINHLPPPVRKYTVQNITLAPNQLLDGKTALVTGGTSGIGFHIAKAFLNSGATVIITSRSELKLKKAITILEQEGRFVNQVIGIAMDNTKVELFQECFDSMFEKLKTVGRKAQIDILVNNAGILGASLPNAKESEFDAVISTNLKGVFFLSQMIGKYFKENKIEGNILNVASSSSLRPAASAYTLSKWGIRGLTIGLAKSLAPFGVTVNGIAPGPTATPMLLGDANIDDISNKINPLGRYALPEEIANMAVMLVSAIGKTVVGDILYMTGGAGVITFDDLEYKF